MIWIADRRSPNKFSLIDMTHRITFVHAPKIRYDQNYGTLFSPLWAYMLAAHVPDGWDVTSADGPKAGRQARYTDRALKALVVDRLDRKNSLPAAETNDR